MLCSRRVHVHGGVLRGQPSRRQDASSARCLLLRGAARKLDDCGTCQRFALRMDVANAWQRMLCSRRAHAYGSTLRGQLSRRQGSHLPRSTCLVCDSAGLLLLARSWGKTDAHIAHFQRLELQSALYFNGAFKIKLLTLRPLDFARRFSSANSSGWQLTEKDTRFTPVALRPPP